LKNGSKVGVMTSISLFLSQPSFNQPVFHGQLVPPPVITEARHFYIVNPFVMHNQQCQANGDRYLLCYGRYHYMKLADCNKTVGINWHKTVSKLK